MEQFAISANFEGAAARWNERERFDSFAKFENFRRQTDGLRRVISNHAIFNRYFGFHLILLPVKWYEALEEGSRTLTHAQALRPAAGRTGSDAQISKTPGQFGRTPVLHRLLPVQSFQTDEAMKNTCAIAG